MLRKEEGYNFSGEEDPLKKYKDLAGIALSSARSVQTLASGFKSATMGVKNIDGLFLNRRKLKTRENDTKIKQTLAKDQLDRTFLWEKSLRQRDENTSLASKELDLKRKIEKRKLAESQKTSGEKLE